MSKRICLVLLALVVIAMAAACSSAEPVPAAIADDMGRQVQLKASPQRIVSHVPGITEMLFALGLDDKIVGVSDHCDYPEAAKAKPKVGGYWTPNIETIVALSPDLVLTDGLVLELKSNLEGLGIPFIVMDPKSIDGVLRDIELLGNVTGSQEKATELTANMKNRIQAVEDTVRDAPRPKVLYVCEATDPTKPWTAGPGSFVDSLITTAGGENVAGNASGAWVQFNMEEFVASDPEIIISNTFMGTAVISPEELKELPGWQDLTAVKENRIYTINGDLVDRAGPRIVQGLEDMAKAIHPELFEQ